MAPASEVAVADAPPQPEVPCSSDAECVDQGLSRSEAGDEAGARVSYEAGCTAGGGRSCDSLASAVADEDASRALELWDKACTLGELGGCFNSAEQLRTENPMRAAQLYARACQPDGADALFRPLACSRGAMTAYGARAYEEARQMAETICVGESVGGCGVLGVMYARGAGVDQDLEKSKGYLDQGCAGGDREACDNLGKVEAAAKQDAFASALPVENANVSIGSIAVDGLSASDLQCRRDGGGGLFGGAMGAISGVSKRKGKLMKCVSAQEDVRVRWEAKGGRIDNVDVRASSPEVAACVEKAVKGASAAFGGTCAATFSIGG